MEPPEDWLRGELVHLGLAPRTVQLYIRTTVSVIAWFEARGWELSEATAEQVAAYIATRPPAWSTRNLLRACLRHYWRLVGHPRPPLAALRVPPKPAMTCKALEPDDARLLAKAARARGDRAGLATLFGLYEGLRREEIATLRWDGIEDGWLTVTGKGTKRRTIPLHPIVAEALGEHVADGEWLFPGRFGGYCNPATVWAWVQQVAEEAGLPPMRPHWLRHTALATANDATGDLRTVQALAGHSRPETTAGYTRATGRRLQEAVLAIDY